MSVATLLFLTTLASTPVQIEMGDGTISGGNIAPYEFRWQQCMLVDGAWQNRGALTEKVTLIGNHVLRIEQTSSPQPGVTGEVAHYLDRSTLAPIRSEAHFADNDGKTLAKRDWTFDEEGYRATVTQGGQTTEKTGALTNSMYNAIILGIPLATVTNWEKPIRMTALMTQLDASYTLTAAQQGKETVTSEDGDTSVRWIDVQWIHNEIGDVYPAGPDGSGGRYWITEEVTAGLPRVIRYKTDTYVIEHLPKFCPSEAGQD